MIEAITVSQLNGYIRNIFEAEELLHNIPVVGEVFGVSTARNITYFQLKDESAVISCVCFYPALAPLIQEGKQIVATGSANFYVKGGKLSFNVTKVEEAGQGKLYEEFLRLKQKLELEGLFDQAHKKPLPESIKRIGVITSKDGAVIQDIKNVSWRRNPSVDIVLYPVKVQGKNAEDEIAHAINALSEYPNIDVIVVARGGGSLEDLWAYNTEIVARATYNCVKPIVSAVGHETDFTIIDFVSDLRAPTPSAAAELLTFNLGDKKQSLYRLVGDFLATSEYFVQSRVDTVCANLNKMGHSLEYKFVSAQGQFSALKTKLGSAMEAYLAEASYNLGLAENSLKRLNPKLILAQGYAKIEQGGQNKRTKAEIDYNENLNIIFADGQLKAKPLKED